MSDKAFKRINDLWDKLDNDLKHNYRFFTGSELLDEIKCLLAKNTITIQKDTVFYRARIYNTKDNQKGKEPFWGYDAEKSFINKKFDEVGDARANPYSIAYLYVTESVYTACTEVRPYLDDYLSVAEIINKESLRVVDLTNFDSEEFCTSGEAYLGWLIARSFSRPVKNGSNYLMSQYISEYIKRLEFDGVKFKSSLDKKGNNLTIFNYDKCYPISSRLYKITDLTIKYEQVDHNIARENQYIDIIDKDGVERRAEVLSVFTINEYKKDYIIYCFPDSNMEDIYDKIQNSLKITSDMITVYVSTLIEKDERYEFCGVTDSEIRSVLEIMKDMAMDEGPLENLKDEINSLLVDPMTTELNQGTSIMKAENGEKYFTFIDAEGQEAKYELLVTLYSDETGKSYVIYTDHKLDNEGNTIVYVSTFETNDGTSYLGSIESEEEWTIILKELDGVDL
jgi:uncharacterized protein YrzB (UPF0473 family)